MVTGQVFTDIADSIRSKTGKTAKMRITEMSAEIDSIETDTRVALQITVNDGSSALSGAMVTASYSGGSTFSGTTDGTGKVTFQVKPGYDYTVSASRSDVGTVSKSVYVDAAGASTTLSATYKPIITVVQNGATGALTISGGAYTSLGNNRYMIEAQTNYTFTVGSVALFVTPSAQTVNKALGQDQTLTFTYVAYPVLTVNQTGATGTVSVSPTAAAQSGNAYTLVPGTAYTVSVSAVTGYFTPSAQSKTMSAGTTDTMTFTYTHKPIVNVTVTDASSQGYQSGRTITATNGSDTVRGTTSSSGTVSLTLNSTGAYTISSDTPSIGGSISPVDITAEGGGTYNVAMTLSFGFSGAVGVVIDESNSSVDGAVTYPQTLTTYNASGTAVGTYTNLAYGATAMSGAGSSFNPGTWVSNSNLYNFIKDIKPVSFDGSTWADLNKTSEDSWPTDRDCFTEFPFRWLSISKSGNYISVVFYGGDTAPDATFCDDAFLKSDASAHNNEFHLGCYTASGSTSAVYSKKGTSNLVSTALNQYWVAAAGRNGSTAGTNYGPYDCMPYAMWTYLQALFLVLYKSRNCQTAHSQGYVGGSAVQSNSAFSSYGNDYGQYGSSSTTQQNAFFWLHNLWGNMYQFSASLFTRAGSSRELYYIKEAMSKASNWDNSSWNSSNYAKQTSLGADTGKAGPSWSSSNYFTKACGNNTAGFCVNSAASTGSASTYWPDYGNVNVYSSRAYFPYLGGLYSNGDRAGLFRCFVNNNSTYSDSNYGSRLAYRGGRA